MRIVSGLVVVLLVACTQSEPEMVMTSANIDDASVPAMLTALDAITDNDLPLDELLEMSKSTPMDEETQRRVPVSFKGQEADMLIHIWREQTDWVHFYASSTSQEFVNAVEAGMKPFARAADD